MVERVILVVKPTRLDELLRRHSRTQAAFILERRGESFAEYDGEHANRSAAVDAVLRGLPREFPRAVISWDFVPRYLFRATDLVVTIGSDGLVVNVAKYLGDQPILAVNPDPERIDGTLARCAPGDVRRLMPDLLRGAAAIDEVTLARATLSDGQALYAVNDFKVGRRDQVSPRYRIRYRSREERQSSSGIIVCTGVGSSGWMRSIVTGAIAIAEACGWKPSGAGRAPDTFPVPFPWDARHLRFAVQEPFPSRYTETSIAFGRIEAGEELVVISEMADGGVVFSDGIADDAMPFPAGAAVRIGVADRTAKLMRP